MEFTPHFQNFRFALQSLVPAFDRASIPWRDEEQYDDFDDIARAVFKSFVLRVVEESLERSDAIGIMYDVGPYTGNPSIYFEVLERDGREIGRFSKYTSRESFFDSVIIWSDPGNYLTFEADALQFRLRCD
jgi:hypothetical protein